ncbi:hypothetical protein [Pseudanabaena sp. PCC 6802]|uniref:hypothetical protein n=1 Tax=Pseudanabaena sp. PCC 6802 TaxID=118173 RepID=UPI000348DA07|nr:hypothetical protein [Pseudanabaena sp. PCC 6802]
MSYFNKPSSSYIVARGKSHLTLTLICGSRSLDCDPQVQRSNAIALGLLDHF